MDNKKAIERANSYRNMINTWAWKDFVNEMTDIQNDASGLIDRIPLDQNAPMLIAEARGERKALQKLLTRLDHILGEGGLSAEEKL